MNALRNLYQKHHEFIFRFADKFPEAGLQGPLFMELSLYFEQKTKLLIVGQETAGWSDEYHDIDAQLEAYRKFNLGERRQGPFWNMTRKIESALGIARCSCAWTNLNRFDQNGKPPSGDILNAISSLDFLLKEEIKIIEPDICVLYTNKKYDHRLMALYPEVEFSNIPGLPNAHFNILAHAELPDKTIRTPHPKTMRIMGWEESFINFIRQ